MKKIFLKSSRVIALAAFLLTTATALLHAADTDFPEFNYLTDGQPNAIALLAPPPLPDSDEQKFELAEVHAVAAAAPSNDIAAALAENKGVSLKYFTPVIGDALTSGQLPRSEAFMKNVLNDAETVTDAAKDHWRRPRPFMADPSFHPLGKLQKTFSYPSGHSTESMTAALVLAELFPDKRDAILAEAREIGWHRVEIARHYPTDIFAGRVLAQAIVRDMDQNPAFQKDLAAAKAEIAAAQK